MNKQGSLFNIQIEIGIAVLFIIGIIAIIVSGPSLFSGIMFVLGILLYVFLKFMKANT